MKLKALYTIINKSRHNLKMSLQKTPIIFKNKHNELKTLVEQKDNHLELVIKEHIDKNTSLPDIITEEANNNEDLQNKILDIYYKLVKEKIKDNIKKHDWYVREYQRNIIDNTIIKLNDIHKLYLELATGGGKSYIIYKIMYNILYNIMYNILYNILYNII